MHSLTFDKSERSFPRPLITMPSEAYQIIVQSEPGPTAQFLSVYFRHNDMAVTTLIDEFAFGTAFFDTATATYYVHKQDLESRIQATPNYARSESPSIGGARPIPLSFTATL